MDIIDVREYILSLPRVEETTPFGDESIVYRIAGKWFAVYIMERPEAIAVKCDPDRAVMLRDRYDAVTPAWHFNKRHWNDLQISHLPTEMVKQEIRHSYLLVIKKNVSPKSLKERLLLEAKTAGIIDKIKASDSYPFF